MDELSEEDVILIAPYFDKKKQEEKKKKKIEREKSGEGTLQTEGKIWLYFPPSCAREPSFSILASSDQSYQANNFLSFILKYRSDLS